MVKIPYIKIPSVRVGSIGPTSNIGTGGATPAPPTPITYLTQWKMMGNSVVHTDEYLTQWKVEGNSVVDNNAILSCGDLGQDGKYHVKISNGVDIYDIALDEPLRKVNDVADTIEFANGVATLTRNIGSAVIGNTTVARSNTNTSNVFRWALKVGAKIFTANILNTKYSLNNRTYYCVEGINADSGGDIQIFDSAYTSADDKQAFIAANADVEIIFELATPTTETIQAPQIAVSSTNTYTSANDTPYSAFTYANPLIYSCGDYSDVDGKYHILVQPLGGSIADIALDEPLRKVNNVADSIEFSNNTAVVTRNIGSRIMGDYNYYRTLIQSIQKYRYTSNVVYNSIKTPADNSKYANVLCPIYDTRSATSVYSGSQNGISIEANDAGSMYMYDENYAGENDFEAFKAHIKDVEVIYELATPTTETIQVPQIQEADSYSCEISQGGKAVSWSSFETDSE